MGEGVRGEGRSRAGKGRCGEAGRGRGFPCSVPGLGSARPHSVALSDRAASVPWGRLCPLLGPDGGLAIAGPPIRSGFPTAHSEVIPKLF